MNQYISAQIMNMKTMTNTFVQACEMAALKDDGTVDREEARQLKRIRQAAADFIRQLERV